MEKLISLRYAGHCRKCGKEIPAGSQALWYGHRHGVSHYPSCSPETPDAKPQRPKTNERVFIIDWGRVRDTYLSLINKTKTPEQVCKRSHNQSVLAQEYGKWARGDDWTGATGEQMKSWITSGFHVPGIENATPDLIPLRTRRRLKFDEDGELQLDLVYSGFDYPFLEWEKRARKPGMRLEIGICFSAHTQASVISHYERWIAQALTTLEESGYDLEVTISGAVRDSWKGNPGIERTLIRVKRENEASDFAEWSALFSPGGFRHLMFLAMILAADDSGQDIEWHLGIPFGLDWSISLEEQTRTLTLDNPKSPASFPEATMTEQFISLIGVKN